MNPEAHQIIDDMQKLRANNLTEAAKWPTHQAPLIARLLVIIAEEQEKAADKMERQTNKLVQQTDILVAFTRGLYWLTIVLLIFGMVQLALAFLH